ncbi:hypothetical protein Scep_016842 [Stephania cephalantha]|uniref:Uncharacterized protein n=1 Tax=Stephania cephalantha TaxID=152367 RepID=A0AAP0NUJ5_9MAGN
MSLIVLAQGGHALRRLKASSKGRKRQSGDSRNNIGDYMLKAVEIMAVEIRKSTAEIAKAILDDKERCEAVVAALEEVYGLPAIEIAIYATKLMKGNKLMVGFLSLEPPYRLAWLQKMFPDIYECEVVVFLFLDKYCGLSFPNNFSLTIVLVVCRFCGRYKLTSNLPKKLPHHNAKVFLF